MTGHLDSCHLVQRSHIKGHRTPFNCPGCTCGAAKAAKAHPCDDCGAASAYVRAQHVDGEWVVHEGYCGPCYDERAANTEDTDA